jgi:hypothetical protein
MHIFYIYIFYILYFFIYFFGVGLDPANPARSLAQASDPAGPHEARVNQITCAWASKFKANDDNELKRKSGKRAKDLPGSFAENLREIAEGDAPAFKFPLAPSACLSRSISFLFLYFCLFFFCVFALFSRPSLLSLGLFPLLFFLGQCWWGKAYFWHGSSGNKPGSSYGFFVFLFFLFFSSLSLTPFLCFVRSPGFFRVPLVFFCVPPPALSHLIWLYSQRMPSILAIETTLSLYSRNGSRGRRRRITSQNDAVCVMGIVIFNLVTEVLKLCNQTRR